MSDELIAQLRAAFPVEPCDPPPAGLQALHRAVDAEFTSATPRRRKRWVVPAIALSVTMGAGQLAAATGTPLPKIADTVSEWMAMPLHMTQMHGSLDTTRTVAAGDPPPHGVSASHHHRTHLHVDETTDGAQPVSGDHVAAASPGPTIGSVPAGAAPERSGVSPVPDDPGIPPRPPSPAAAVAGVGPAPAGTSAPTPVPAPTPSPAATSPGTSNDAEGDTEPAPPAAQEQARQGDPARPSSGGDEQGNTDAPARRRPQPGGGGDRQGDASVAPKPPAQEGDQGTTPGADQGDAQG